MLRSRILTGLVLAAFAGIFASQVASCTLDTDGTQPPVVTGEPCKVDANCDDKNPCTNEICPQTTGVCEYTKQAMGDAPNAAQISEDCKTIVCNDGEPSTVDDPQDFNNDNNSCTTDACVGGVPTNVVLADNSQCKQGTKDGQCQMGTCTITCKTNIECDDGNPCSDDLCNTSLSKCVYTSIDGLPTPGLTPVVGDCKLHICDGGIDKEINDDADVNNDSNPCTTDICTAGTPSNPPVPERTYCIPGEVKVCDAMGTCVECVVAADCVNIVETECEKRSCVNNTCQIAYEGQTTLASPVLQKAKDCKKVVCNGNMGTVVVNDDGDLPDDSNPCTTDTCSNGAPAYANKMQGTTCGASQVCNANGGCVGCNAPKDCAGTDDFCKTRTCDNMVCGISYTANGTDMPSGQMAGDCKVLECDGAGNVKSSVLQSDVPVDGNACTQDVCDAQGAPSNPATAINSACNVNGNDACDGNGNCKKSLGKMCGGAGSECVSTNCVDGVCCNESCTITCQSCNVPGSVGTCSDVPKGQDDGTCTGATVSCNINHDCDDENGQSCGGANTCLSNFCADGVCCNAACDMICQACSTTAGAMTNGTCSNIPSGTQDNFPANTCVTPSVCDGNGACKKPNGETCGNGGDCVSTFCVDGVCCDTACTTACRACSTAAGAAVNGTCGNVAQNQQDSFPANACTGVGACSAGGLCINGLGQTCTMASQCASGFCVDGNCCNSACTGNCQACSMAAGAMINGTCGNIASGTEDNFPANTCVTPSACDGSGVCKKNNSQTCTVAGECASGFCVDGRCCNSACDTLCQACSMAAGATTNGMCGNIASNTVDNFPANTCNGTNRCDGMGGCKKQNGQTCGNGSDCLSTFCVDGVCCNSACTTTCQACSAAAKGQGSDGTCQNIISGTQDNFPANACSGSNACNGNSGGGACKLKNGQSCMNNPDCASNKCIDPGGGKVCTP